jgi:hypothetical protein
LGDGIKNPKRGRKMPAVKRLHQVSDNNTKPEYIMGHSIQAVSLLVSAATTFFAIPLSARIHEGVIFSNRDRRTLPRKFLSLVDDLGIGEPVYLVADAYYACRTVALGLVASGSHLVSRLRKNAVAYHPAPQPPGKRKRGRPRLYGLKLRLSSLFDNSDCCRSRQSEEIWTCVERSRSRAREARGSVFEVDLGAEVIEVAGGQGLLLKFLDDGQKVGEGADLRQGWL